AGALVPASGGEGAEAAEAPVAGPAAPAGDVQAALSSLTIGVDEALKRSGAELRAWMLEEGPTSEGRGMEEGLGEVLGGWLPAVEAAGRQLLHGSAGLLQPVSQLGNTLAALPAALTQPWLAAGPEAVPGVEQLPEVPAEAVPGEAHSTGWDLLLAAG